MQGIKTLDEVLEKLRKKLVFSNRSGKNLMIDIAKTLPDFATQYTNDNIFKADLVFNHAEWQKPENHMKFVKEDEK